MLPLYYRRDPCARRCSSIVIRVLDKTGLTGSYEFTLRYGTQAPGSDASPADDAPSIFTALQERPGLKLEADRGALQVVVIDHIERPGEDRGVMRARLGSLSARAGVPHPGFA